ncbi:MAG TPA: ParA family protein [Pseudogracilibacillus sp.]|nr:ParA family protein [Pseudogracilibacillus sp.]
MVARVITFGLQKGGVSKTTTTGIMTYLMSKEKKKVLAVDFDSQGNLTELLTNQPANNFLNKSIFEAIALREYKQPSDFIYQVNDYIDVLPANNLLSSYPRWLYTNNLPNIEEKVFYKGSSVSQLNLMLEIIKSEYDYILIDTPPALSEQTTNALAASDYVVVLYECSKFCYSAIENFLETIELIQNSVNKGIINLGILRTLSDKRRKDAHFFNEVIEKEYPKLVFETIITRKATTGRLPLRGFDKNHELDEALSQYVDFYDEILQRIIESEDKQ